MKKLLLIISLLASLISTSGLRAQYQWHWPLAYAVNALWGELRRSHQYFVLQRASRLPESGC